MELPWVNHCPKVFLTSSPWEDWFQPVDWRGLKHSNHGNCKTSVHFMWWMVLPTVYWIEAWRIPYLSKTGLRGCLIWLKLREEKVWTAFLRTPNAILFNLILWSTLFPISNLWHKSVRGVVSLQMQSKPKKNNIVVWAVALRSHRPVSDLWICSSYVSFDKFYSLSTPLSIKLRL